MKTGGRSLFDFGRTAGLAPIACAVLLALGCGAGKGESLEADSEEEGDADASVLVQTEAIEQGSVAEALTAIGLVEFDPTRVRTIPFTQAGEVVAVQVVPGQRVQKGEVLAALGPLPSGSLDSQRVRMEVDYARRDLERVQRLREENLATNADVQNAEKAMQSSSAELRSMGAGSSKSRRELIAPEAGLIAQVQVAPGTLVQSGQVAVSIAPPDALMVRVGFDPEDAARLQPDLPVTLVPLFARGDAEPIPAQLTRVQFLIDAATQRVEAMIRVSDPKVPMFAGERIRVRVEPESSAKAVVVPRAALTERDGKEGVFVVEDEKAHWRPLEIGLRGEEAVEARAGVAAGDVVVVAGHSSLEDDRRIRVETADVAKGAADDDAKEAADKADPDDAKGAAEKPDADDEKESADKPEAGDAKESADEDDDEKSAAPAGEARAKDKKAIHEGASER